VGVIAPALGGAALAAFQTLAGQLAFALLVTALFSGLGTGGSAGRVRMTVANGVGMILFVLLLFLTYSGYDIALPFPSTALVPVAAAILAVCAVIATRGMPVQVVAPSGGGERRSTDWYPALAAALLLILPGVVVTTVRAPTPSPLAAHDGMRVMTFNIHNGFDTKGWLGLEAIARTIEQQQPDVVTLQEAARGWVIDGSTDMLSWLSQRLDMPYVWDPTAGPLWGNAILSRFPITQYETHPLPTADLLLGRGFVRARLDVGGGQTLDVLATHYHHLEDGSSVRVQQSQAILDAWAGTPRTVIAGDMNAVPGDPEIEMLRAAGLVEAVSLAGLTPGYTYDSTKPYQRIDYIWVSQDLVAMSIVQGVRDVVITTGGASDHLGIAATLAR
jgi:endonuclease/exonuclease/phosphatase family metal-dependent hydrolase